MMVALGSMSDKYTTANRVHDLGIDDSAENEDFIYSTRPLTFDSFLGIVNNDHYEDAKLIFDLLMTVDDWFYNESTSDSYGYFKAPLTEIITDWDSKVCAGNSCSSLSDDIVDILSNSNVETALGDSFSLSSIDDDGDFIYYI